MSKLKRSSIIYRVKNRVLDIYYTLYNWITTLTIKKVIYILIPIILIGTVGRCLIYETFNGYNVWCHYNRQDLNFTETEHYYEYSAEVKVVLNIFGDIHYIRDTGNLGTWNEYKGLSQELKNGDDECAIWRDSRARILLQNDMLNGQVFPIYKNHIDNIEIVLPYAWLVKEDMNRPENRK